MRKKSSRNTGQQSPDSATSKTLAANSSSQSTSLPVASPARISQSQGGALVSPVSGRGSGESSEESSKKSDPLGSSSKTSPRSEPEGSPLSSATFTRSGLMLNGIVYPLAPSAPLTGVTGSSLLPTPSASRYGSNKGGGAGRTGKERLSLDSMATRGLLPSHDSGPLSPVWVEWAMGFPLGWTDLEG